MINLQQMLGTMLSNRISLMQNPMVQELIQMRQRGVPAQEAVNQLAQRYPQFRQFQGRTPQQMDQAAKATIRQSGMNPDAVIGQIMKMF